MKRFILYLAAVFLTVYMAVIYKSRILTALAAIEVLIPLPVMILGFITARLLRVELSVPAEAVSRNDPVKVLLSVENRSVFPMVYGIAGIQCQNRFRKLKASRNILIQAPGRRKIEYLCQWTSQHCGTLDFSLKYLKVHDYLHLMVFRVRLDQSAEAAVLPVPVHVEVPLEHRNPISEDGEKYDPYKSGDDPSEVFDIREYRQGDRLSRIHWKMTAKEEELMVKNTAGLWEEREFCVWIFTIPRRTASGKTPMSIWICWILSVWPFWSGESVSGWSGRKGKARDSGNRAWSRRKMCTACWAVFFGHGPIKQNFLWRRGSQSSVPRQPHPFCTAWT